MLMILRSGLFSMLWGGILMAMAQGGEADKLFQARLFSSGQDSLPYRLLMPKDYDAGKQYPLVLFYHGAGERGSDNRKQLVHGMDDFASDEVRDQYPCFVVAPQCPEGAKWVETDWSADTHTMPAAPSEPLRLSLELIDALQDEFSIDPRRLYVTGLSMGGFAVWDALQRYPRRFAAAVPICGGGDSALAERLVRVPIWAFHGAADPVVKPQCSRAMIEAVKSAGGMPRYTEYPGVGHDAWVATYVNPKLYLWLFTQRRPE